MDLPVIPLFFNLRGRKVLVVGDGAGADYKATLLTSCGADVVRRTQEGWQGADFETAALAIGALADEDAIARFVSAARARHVPVNIVDKPQHCDFKFGTIVDRSPVVIGISTDGVVPVLGQELRARIETLLPAWLGARVGAARALRKTLPAYFKDFAARRRFWQFWVARVFALTAGPHARTQDFEREDKAILADALAQEDARRTGEAVLVGAGPGDPALLTLGAVRALREADVILYDALVSQDVLAMGRREAERIDVGKEGHAQSVKQETVSALMVAHAKEGKTVVRLKGGDPVIFGRAGEEVAACAAAGIPVRIIPGITTASAAAAALGLSLSHRNLARRVQFITGHSLEGALPDFNMAALADPFCTTCVYMPKHTASILAQRLIAAGMAADAGVVVASDVGRAGQTFSRTTLGALRAGAFGFEPSSPALLIFGRVVEGTGEV